MKKTINKVSLIIAVFLSFVLASTAITKTSPIRYECSHQVYETIENYRLNAFTKATGIPVELSLACSNSCAVRVMNGSADIGSTTKPLYAHHKKAGMVAIPFCRNPMAIIVSASLNMNEVTTTELEGIFSGSIANWKELDGPDIPITLVVPNQKCDTYKTFKRKVMPNKKIQHNYLVNQHNHILDAIESLPAGAVAFISQGAKTRHQAIKALSVDGKKINDYEYPLYQTFYLVTKGPPKGNIKTFVDFVKSDTGIAMIQNNGMTPLLNDMVEAYEEP